MAETPSNYSYQIGGSLPVNANSYVTRQADTELYQGLKAGQFCYVLNSRQMGKSSLRVRTMQRLQAEGFVCAFIDLTGIGKEDVNPEKWYAGIINALVGSCNLSRQVEWRNWWRERRDLLSPVQRLSLFIDEVLLTEVEQNIVVFVDEIDRVLSQTFSLDDFFALIRYFYNQRADHPKYQRLTFTLLGVATPSDLIADKTQTPFNIGRAIALQGFQLHEVQPLVTGLQGKVSDPQAAIATILGWTGGQPFLTQKLCQLVIQNASNGNNLPASNLVDQIVRTHLLENWEAQDEPEHLKTIRDRLLRNQQKAGLLLGLYQQILQQGTIAADGSPEQTELRLSGLVVQQQGWLSVYNRIYQQVFHSDWLEQQLAKLRPYFEALNAWGASNCQDESRLLRGEALQDALAWSKNQHLIDLDYRFMAASQDLEKREVQQALAVKEEESQILAEANEILAIAQKTAATELAQAKSRARKIISIGSGILALSLTIAAIIQVQMRTAQRELAEKELFLQGFSATTILDSNPFAGMVRALKAAHQLKQLEASGAVSDPTRNQVETALRKAVYKTREYYQLKGHQGAIYGVGFSPDGKLLASGSEDHTVKLWNVQDGTQRMTLKGHREQLWSVRFSPDGQLLASGSRDYTVKLWRVRDGELLHTLTGHQNWVRSVGFSPDGKLLASSDSDGIVKVWKVEDATLIHTVQAHPRRWATHVSFSPNGQLLASTGSDGTIKVWNARDRTLQKVLKGHRKTIRSVSFSPDGKTLASGSEDGTIRLWDIKTGTALRAWEEHRSRVWSVQFSPDGKTLASSSSDSTIKLWDLNETEDANTESITLRGHIGSVWSIQFSPDGKALVSGGADRTVRLWKIEPAAPKTYALSQTDVLTMSLHPAGKRLVAGSKDGTLQLWDVENNRLLKDLKGHQKRILSVRFSPDGKRVASSSADKTIKLWNGEDGSLLKTFTDRRHSFGSVRFNPDGKTLITSTNNLVKLWNLENGSVIRVLKDNPRDRCSINTINPSPDGKTLAIGCAIDTIRLWDMETGKSLKTLSGHSGRTSSVDFSPDGRLLVSGGEDGTVKLWNVADGTLLKTLFVHLDNVRRVNFSPNGKLLASASNDRTIRLWSVEHGNLLQTLEGHRGPINSLSFSQDGMLLASASFDNTVKLWRLDLNFDDLVQLSCNWLKSYLTTHPEEHEIREVCQSVNLTD